MFEFTMRAVHRDRDPYYYTNWDNAQRMTVRGDTKQEAINKADAMLGPAPRGRYWVFQVDDIKEVSPCTCQSSAASS